MLARGFVLYSKSLLLPGPFGSFQVNVSAHTEVDVHTVQSRRARVLSLDIVRMQFSKSDQNLLGARS